MPPPQRLAFCWRNTSVPSATGMKNRMFQLSGPDSAIARRLVVRRVVVFVTDGNYAAPERSIVCLTINRALRTRLRIADPAVNGGVPLRTDCTCILSANPSDVGLGAFTTIYTPQTESEGVVWDVGDDEAVLLHGVEISISWPFWTLPDDKIAQVFVELECN